jgi:hypothetical protein
MSLKDTPCPWCPSLCLLPDCCEVSVLDLPHTTCHGALPYHGPRTEPRDHGLDHEQYIFPPESLFSQVSCHSNEKVTNIDHDQMATSSSRLILSWLRGGYRPHRRGCCALMCQATGGPGWVVSIPEPPPASRCGLCSV